MKKNLISSALAVIVFTLLLGIAYPLVVTGIAQVAFRRPTARRSADGKLDAARTTRRRLDAKDGPSPTAYFQPRPSATEYSASATFFANRGPNQSSARYFYRDAARGLPQARGPVQPRADEREGARSTP